MGANAAYNVGIAMSGTATTFTGEATTLVGVKTYRITNSAKALWDPFNTLTVYDGATPLDAEDISSINYVTGTVVLVATPGGAVTVTGKYLATAILIGGKSYSLKMGGDVLDSTDQSTARASGTKSRQLGLRDVSLTVSRWAPVYDVTLHPEKVFSDLWASGARFFITIYHADGSAKRGWFIVASNDQSGDVSALESEDINFELDGNATENFAIA